MKQKTKSQAVQSQTWLDPEAETVIPKHLKVEEVKKEVSKKEDNTPEK